MNAVSDALLKFWESLPVSLRALIRYRVLRITGKTVEEIIKYNPRGVYRVLVDAMGRHNADLIINMFYDWLLRSGRRVDLKEVNEFLGRAMAEAV
ncbi:MULTISPECIES: hypothetical protein [Pyrobaculum]|uniref:Family 453 n=1 Tax=Pyrobaculum arsenaticum (strain DSM 13514 / JCM 11321 / PZ6) TaxID=340102 RepID=A4WJ74_PYRAR|nr:hypothetical protein [Pyrobaculum arsenaticum]ABP50441.1 family 453 [Pyrobaculum arsenaticum DSM 13514]MCY0890432.1 hypothetical protein [Pyrobaculum arsenaticum]